MKVLSLFLSLVLWQCVLAGHYRQEKWRTEIIRLQKPKLYAVDVQNNTRNENIIKNSKIVNGLTATATNDFAYQALIFIDRPLVKGNQCGGAILSEKWMVSAKHCVTEAMSIEIRVAGLSRYRFVFRTYANSYAKSATSDVVVISMKDKVTFSNAVNFVRMPRISQRNDLFTGRIATVTGYGIDNQATSSMSDNLQYATVKIISGNECEKTFGPPGNNKTVICAIGYPDTKSGSCPGDSGGPLVILEMGVPTLIGTVGFGAAKGCDIGLPVGYSRITEQMDWITSYTRIPLRP